jgi:hypothetical protein
VRNIYSQPEINKLEPAEIDAIPENMRVRETFSPRFSKDMKVLYFGIYDWNVKEKKDKDKKDEKIPDVDI